MGISKNQAIIKYIKQHMNLTLELRDSYCEDDVIALEVDDTKIIYFKVNANVITGNFELRVYRFDSPDKLTSKEKHFFNVLKLALDKMMCIIRTVETNQLKLTKGTLK